MSRDGRCRHPDCAYRNHSNPIQQGRCNYMAITGRSRIKGLPPELQKPCNCPYYETDGSRGLGQWRNSGKGRFLAEEITD